MQIKALTDEQTKQIREYHKASKELFGAADAEHDADTPGWLEDLFVDFSEIEPGLKGKAPLIVGRKGAGKSAIRITSERRAKKKGNSPLHINASADQLLAAHAEISKSLGLGPNPSVEGSVGAWNRTFLYLVLRELASKLTGRAIVSKANEAVRNWALDEGFVSADWGEWLIQSSRRLLPEVESALNKLSAQPPPLTQARITDIINKTQYLISVDDFDNIYSAGHRTEGVRTLQAAIEAADRFSRRKDLSSVTLYLREDLWLLARNNWHYLDKIQNVLEIQWTQEQLKQWTHRRLQKAVAEALGMSASAIQVSFDNLWKVFFPSEIHLENGTKSSGFYYLLRKTMYTPRDLQRLLAVCAECSRSFPVSPESILKAEEKYAQDRIDFISNEFESLCEGISVALNSFAGKPLQWLASELFKHLRGLIDTGQVKLAPGASLGQTDEVALARFLFRVGFLEIRISDGDRFEVRDGVRYPDFWRGIRRDDAIQWAVRSAYYRYLKSHADSRRFFE